MSQKPIDQRGYLDTREALWEVMLKLRSFTAPELAKHTRYHVSTVSDYLKGLLAAGYLTLHSEGRPPTYQIDPDTAPLDPPRVRKDGTEVSQGAGRKNMWRAAKILVEFSPLDLVAFGGSRVVIAENEAIDYCRYLQRAGYLILVSPAKALPGRTRYRFDLTRYTGPKPPQVQRVKQVWDPNTKQVVWRSREVADAQ